MQTDQETEGTIRQWFAGRGGGIELLRVTNKPRRATALRKSTSLGRPAGVCGANESAREELKRRRSPLRNRCPGGVHDHREQRVIALQRNDLDDLLFAAQRLHGAPVGWVAHTFRVVHLGAEVIESL